MYLDLPQWVPKGKTDYDESLHVYYKDPYYAQKEALKYYIRGSKERNEPQVGTLEALLSTLKRTVASGKPLNSYEYEYDEELKQHLKLLLDEQRQGEGVSRSSTQESARNRVE